MANAKIFCTVPWTNTHIYWDGQYGLCCSESHPPADKTHNLKFHSVKDWYSGAAMTDFRQRILGNEPLSECSACYREEAHYHESRRIRENFKAAIFTEQAFDRSYAQTPWQPHFTSDTDRQPIDWHVDFGNECNLACKMCWPGASSKIAQQYVKWGLSDSVPSNWTNDPVQWTQFLASVDHNKNLNRIHVMGGEPTINKRYTQFVQHLIDQGRTNISMSFVSNGTVINKELLELLKQFREVNVEISLESIHQNNHYIRQGSNTAAVMDNIQWLKNNTDFQIVLRSVPQLLNVNNYDQYIQWAFDNQLPIQSIPLQQPDYLAINVLPNDIRIELVDRYFAVRDYILSQSSIINTIAVGRDANRLPQQLIRECDMVVNLLLAPEPDNVEQLRNELIMWLVRWDRLYQLDATQFYPEYVGFLEAHGYEI